MSKEPLARLLHLERSWAFDTVNVKLMVQVFQAAEACGANQHDFEAVVRWLKQLVRTAYRKA